MRHYRLTNQERAATGFTDAFGLDHKDLVTTSGTTENITLETLGANVTMLYTDACAIVTEAFSGTGITEVKLDVGHNGINGGSADPDHFIDDKSVFTVNGFAGGATGATSHNITTATVLDVLFTTTGAAPSLVTAGQVVIYMKVIRQSDVLNAQA